MVTLDITSFGTNPSRGDISQALQDAGLTSSEVNRVVVASSATIPTQGFQSWSHLCEVRNIDTCVGIGSYAFAGTNMGLTYDSGPYLVDLGNCSSIGEGAFSGCGALHYVSLASAASVPDYCFKYCYSLSSVTNLEHVVSIGAEAFVGCHYLPNFYIDDCREIGYAAFMDCTFTSKARLNKNGVLFGESNGEYRQFANCQDLYAIENLEYQTKFPPDALDGCHSIYDIRLDNCTELLYPNRPNPWDLGGTSDVQMTLNEGLWGHDTSYGEPYAGYVLSGLKSNINYVNIMHSVSSKFTIGAVLFSGCTNLTSVDGYFYSSGDYSSGTDPKVSLSATGLRDCSFMGTDAFKDTKIGWGLYGKSEELANIEYIGYGAFQGAHLGESWDSSEQGQDSDRGLWVDRNCVHMGAYAFAGNPSLRWIGLPGPSSYSSVYTVSDVEALVGSRRLSIDNGQFSGCSGLSSIINLEFQKSFSTTAIVGCNSMTFLNLFYVDEAVNCSSTDLSDVPISGIHIGPQLASKLNTAVDIFHGCSMLEHVIVATSTGADGYQFSIPDNCFCGISTLTSVEGLYSCSGIGSHAFDRTNIEFSKPDQLMYVRNIGNGAFNGCQQVDVDYLGNCVGIGASAFAYNPNISELVFGSSMEYIGDGAFNACTSLNVVYFNNNVYPSITLGSNAFANCGNLSEVCLTNTAQTIKFGYECFYNDSYLDHIYNLNTVYSGSFGDCMFYNTNVQENTINIYYPNQIGGSAFRGIYHDWYLPHISMVQVPTGTKWGLEEGMKIYLNDGVIEG